MKVEKPRPFQLEPCSKQWERVTPLASTGSEVGLELQVGASLLGLGMFLVAIRSGRRLSH